MIANSDTQKMLWYRRSYFKEFSAAMIVMAAVALLQPYVSAPTGLLHIVMTVLPALPVGMILLAMARLLTRLDELERLIHLYSYAAAALLSAFIGMTYSYLESLGAPRLSISVIFPLIIGLWGLANCIFSRKFGVSNMCS